MTLCLHHVKLGTTSSLSPAVSRFTHLPVGSWGRHGETHNHPELVVRRSIHNSQPLLPLLEDHYFKEREGKSPQ